MSEATFEGADFALDNTLLTIGILGKISVAEASVYAVKQKYKDEASLLIEQFNNYLDPQLSVEKYLYIGRKVVELTSYIQGENTIYSVNHFPSLYDRTTIRTKLQSDSLIDTPKNGTFGELHLFDPNHLDERGVPKSGCPRPLNDKVWNNIFIPVRKVLQNNPLLFNRHK